MTKLRASVTSIVIVAAAALSYAGYKTYWKNAAVASVRIAMVEYAAGRMPSNLVLMTQPFGHLEPLDAVQFLADIKAGFELVPGREMGDGWHLYEVEIRTANGTRYVASSGYTKYEDVPGVHIEPEWVIVCCRIDE